MHEQSSLELKQCQSLVGPLQFETQFAGVKTTQTSKPVFVL